MLSFFRTKSSEATVDKIINGIEHLATKTDEKPVDVAASMDTISKQSDNPNPSSLLKSLGYENETELRETIYGELIFFKLYITLNYYARIINQVIFFLQTCCAQSEIQKSHQRSKISKLSMKTVFSYSHQRATTFKWYDSPDFNPDLKTSEIYEIIN